LIIMKIPIPPYLHPPDFFTKDPAPDPPQSSHNDTQQISPGSLNIPSPSVPLKIPDTPA
jgi:hypothetical protein